MWGTIHKTTDTDTPTNAKAVCMHGGYSKGVQGDGTESNRTGVDCLVKTLFCKGTSTSLDTCLEVGLVNKTEATILNKTAGWDHKEDLAVKCSV